MDEAMSTKGNETDWSDAHGRALKLYWPPQSQPELVEQVAILKDMLLRLIQEVHALKQTLRDHNLLDQFEKNVRESVLNDQGGPGASPETRYTMFAYLLSDNLYMRTVVGLDDAEMERFEEQVRSQQALT